jgi:hypothetical protein
MICDKPDLTLQAVLAGQLRRVRHALVHNFMVARNSPTPWNVES